MFPKEKPSFFATAKHLNDETKTDDNS
jgi:hypothetical protein